VRNAVSYPSYRKAETTTMVYLSLLMDDGNTLTNVRCIGYR
jgi:hypothetical protein